LSRRQQNRLGSRIKALDTHEAAQIVPDIQCELFGEVQRRNAAALLHLFRLALRALRPTDKGERQCIGTYQQSFQTQRHSGHINHGRLLELFDVTDKRPAQRRELPAIMHRQPGLCALQGNQRGLEVAGKLKLLRGDRHRLFDFGHHAVFARAGELLIQGFQRRGLALCLLDLGLKRTQLALQTRDQLLLLARNGTCLSCDSVTLRQPACELFAQA